MNKKYELTFTDEKILLSSKDVITPLLVTRDIETLITHIKDIYTDHTGSFNKIMEKSFSKIITRYIDSNYKDSDGKILDNVGEGMIVAWEIILIGVLRNIRYHIRQKSETLGCFFDTEFIDYKFMFNINDVTTTEQAIITTCSDNCTKATGSIIFVVRNTKDEKIYQFTVTFNRYLNFTIVSKCGTLVFK